jgi:hypothetical protein
MGLVHPKHPEPPMIPPDTHLQIGSLLFEGVDQIDLTGPFEVLSRIPNSTIEFTANHANRFATSGGCG